MNCTDVRDRLPSLLYGDLPPGERNAVEEHATGCPACRDELAALRQVRQLLDQVAAPAVTVDLGRLYQQAAERQALRARHWRRAALALTAAAAALLVVAFGLRLEIRAEGHQLVLRWGTPPLQEQPAAPKESSDPPVMVQAERLSDEFLQSRLAVQSKLIHALAAELERRDQRREAEIDALRERLRLVQSQAVQQWASTKRQMDALDAAVFELPKKGAIP